MEFYEVINQRKTTREFLKQEVDFERAENVWLCHAQTVYHA